MRIVFSEHVHAVKQRKLSSVVTPLAAQKLVTNHLIVASTNARVFVTKAAVTNAKSFINKRVFALELNCERFSAERLTNRRSKSEDSPVKKNVRKLLNAEITDVHNLAIQVRIMLSDIELNVIRKVVCDVCFLSHTRRTRFILHP